MDGRLSLSDEFFPLELLKNIFIYLNFSDLFNVIVVSKKFLSGIESIPWKERVELLSSSYWKLIQAVVTTTDWENKFFQVRLRLQEDFIVYDVPDGSPFFKALNDMFDIIKYDKKECFIMKLKEIVSFYLDNEDKKQNDICGIRINFSTDEYKKSLFRVTSNCDLSSQAEQNSSYNFYIDLVNGPLHSHPFRACIAYAHYLNRKKLLALLFQEADDTYCKLDNRLQQMFRTKHLMLAILCWETEKVVSKIKSETLKNARVFATNYENSLDKLIYSKSVEFGNLALVQHCAKTYKININHPLTIDGLCSLQLAVEFSHPHIIEYLIDEGADVNCCEIIACHVLLIACKYLSEFSIIDYLIYKGAKIDINNFSHLSALSCMENRESAPYLYYVYLKMACSHVDFESETNLKKIYETTQEVVEKLKGMINNPQCPPKVSEFLNRLQRFIMESHCLKMTRLHLRYLKEKKEKINISMANHPFSTENSKINNNSKTITLEIESFVLLELILKGRDKPNSLKDDHKEILKNSSCCFIYSLYNSMFVVVKKQESKFYKESKIRH